MVRGGDLFHSGYYLEVSPEVPNHHPKPGLELKGTNKYYLVAAWRIKFFTSSRNFRWNQNTKKLPKSNKAPLKDAAWETDYFPFLVFQTSNNKPLLKTWENTLVKTWCITKYQPSPPPYFELVFFERCLGMNLRTWKSPKQKLWWNSPKTNVWLFSIHGFLTWISQILSHFHHFHHRFPVLPTLTKALPRTIFETTVATKGISPLFNTIYVVVAGSSSVTWWSREIPPSGNIPPYTKYISAAEHHHQRFSRPKGPNVFEPTSWRMKDPSWVS